MRRNATQSGFRLPTLSHLTRLWRQLLIDFMRNNFWDHPLRRRLRCRTRQFCKLHASSITKSEKSTLRFRNTSLTIRARLTPAIACSTRTRTREMRRLRRFSAGLSSPLRGFFSAGKFHNRAGHNLERPYLDAAWPRVDRQSVLDPQPSCLASCQHRFGSSNQCV